MSPVARRHWRRARFAAIGVIAAALIAAAVFVGLVQLLLPLATRYPDFVARELSARLHRPVTFTSIRSEWQPSGPLLSVSNLTLGPAQAGGPSMTLPHAALKFDFGAWLRPSHRWITLRLNDMELRLERTSSGWSVAGFANGNQQSHAALQTLPVDLDLSNLRVDLVDSVQGRAWKLFAPRLRVVNVGDVIRFGGSIQQVGTRQLLQVNGSMDSVRRAYELHALTRNLDLAEAVRGLDLHGYSIAHGQGDIELWGRWQDGKLASAAARYDLRGLKAAGPGGRSLELAAFAGVARATRVDNGWDLRWRGPGKLRADIDDAGGVLVQLRKARGAWQVTAAARAIDATPWLALLAMAPPAPTALVDWVREAQPELHIDSAALVWNDADRYAATLRFSNLRIAAMGAIPGVELVGGTLRADAHAAALELTPGPATVAVTHVFRWPFVFHRLAGTLVASRNDGHWQVDATQLKFDTGTLAGSGHARLSWLEPGKPPFLEAYATVDRAEVTDGKLFWPYISMPPQLVAYLDRAFVGGRVVTGRALVRGPLADWPFLGHEGRFEASGIVHGATFDYAPGWPAAHDVDAAVDFVDNRMAIVATHARVRDVTATRAVATIPDLAHGVLGLDVDGNGKGGELLDFVRNSPIGAGAAEALQGLTLGGTGKFGIKLSIPLDKAENFALDGRLDLAHAAVDAPKWKLQLADLGGAFLIKGPGFRADQLTANFRGVPAKLSLAVGSGVADRTHIVEATLDATTSLQVLAQGYPELDGLIAHAHGVAPFHVSVDATAATATAPASATLGVASTMQGVALDFPAPLDKPALATLPLNFSLQIPPDGAPLSVSLGDVLRVRGRLPDSVRMTPLALAVAFGTTPPTSVPARGLVVGGTAPRLDLGGWIGLAVDGSSSDAFPPLEHADVTTTAATVFDTDLGALHVKLDADAGVDTIALDGPAVQGKVVVPLANLMTRGISADLQRLHWPAPPPAAPGASAAPPSAPSAASPMAPTAIPPLHVSIADFRLGAAQLGATTFESAPIANGMRIARFASKGEDFSINEHGDWIGTAAASQSHMVIDVAANEFGDMLDAFGYKGLLAGGKDAKLHIDGTWPGAPSSFSLAAMSGSLRIEAGTGRILALKPGFGRLLGLLSLRELPSRLLLHFGDVFKSGFGFDHASATLAFKDGDALTHDLTIKAPAAQIAMQGRTGFRARDFDATIHVTPHVGGTLPVVGAVLGGPVGAAAGLVVQGLIGKGINKAAGSTYRVTGGWDKPKIVELESHGPAHAASAGAPASPSSVATPAPATSG